MGRDGSALTNVVLGGNFLRRKSIRLPLIVFCVFVGLSLSSLAQAGPGAENALQTIKNSFERNIDPESFCRKDAPKATQGDAIERWIEELTTCLGSFGVQARTINEMKKEQDAVYAEIVVLNKRLSYCLKDEASSKAVSPDSHQSLLQLVNVLKEELDACDKKISKQTKVKVRLGFAFAGKNLGSMTAAVVERDGIPGPGRRITEKECHAALDWLFKQPDWYFPRLWVFRGDSLRLCERRKDGDRVVEPSEPNAEAHAIVLREGGG